MTKSRWFADSEYIPGDGKKYRVYRYRVYDEGGFDDDMVETYHWYDEKWEAEKVADELNAKEKAPEAAATAQGAEK